MKNIIIMFSICASLFAQQTITWNRMHKPKVGKRDAFIRAVSEKTKKYNTEEGTAVIRTYQVINGPNVGSFLRSGRPGSWKQYDNPPSNMRTGRDYWRKNVMPYVEEAGAQKIWEILTEVSYNGTGDTAPPKLYKVRYYHLRPGASMLGLARKLKEALVATKSEVRITWYRLESGGDRSTWAVGTAHDNFESLGDDQTWRDAYEQHHGKGALQDFMKEFGEIVQSNPHARFAENYRYRPDMSSPE